MYSGYEIKNDTLTVHDIDRLSLERSCACGQSFRWQNDGEGFTAPAWGRMIHANQEGKDLVLTPCGSYDARLWLDYFDLDRSYADIEAKLLLDPELAPCVPAATGIRVFRQEPFETLITFIISANNNIKRIAGIVERLCALSGEKTNFRGKEYSLFPSPEAVASLTVDELTGIGAGYRAPFIKKSAGIIADGYDLAALERIPLDKARKAMLEFPGVGPKVADCVLLFALGHTDAFPVDVWIDRAMTEIYFGGDAPRRAELEKTIRALGDESGIVQQYIFHYARETRLGVRKQDKTG